MVMKFGGSRSGIGGRLPYTLEGVALKFVKSYRNLGVEVDQNFKFHVHADAVVRKAGGLLGNLLRSTKCRTMLFVPH